MDLGAKVEVATSYAGAIAFLEAMDFDVVVSDLNLGDGPGGTMWHVLRNPSPGTVSPG